MTCSAILLGLGGCAAPGAAGPEASASLTSLRSRDGVCASALLGAGPAKVVACGRVGAPLSAREFADAPEVALLQATVVGANREEADLSGWEVLVRSPDDRLAFQGRLTLQRVRVSCGDESCVASADQLELPLRWGAGRYVLELRNREHPGRQVQLVLRLFEGPLTAAGPRRNPDGIRESIWDD
jgi:hypothetical protein